MTSVKIKFRPSCDVGKEGSLYYQVIHGKDVRQCYPGMRIFPHEWDARLATPVCPTSDARFAFVNGIKIAVREDMKRFARIVCRFDSSGHPYTAADVVDEFERLVGTYSLFRYIDILAGQLKESGRHRTAETYLAAKRSFSRFRNGRDVMLDVITPELMQAYEAYLRRQGIRPNTVSFYMRILRAVYNRGVECGDIEDRHPFRHVYTGIGKTVKRALPLETIRRIKALDLTSSAKTGYARDMFMLSFYLRGMSLIDMAYLRRSDLRGGYLTYRRRKTGQTLVIKWTDEMQQVIDSYPAAGEYLLPIINPDGGDDRKVYRNKASMINRRLGVVGDMVGINHSLTMYCARHSWATAARAKGIPLSVISEGLGHESESTTLIYLASIESSAVDHANSIILKEL